ncbi:MAG: YihY/virulence factor BrkB family protein [Planctomycetota bacterium]|jgi:membrane protein
MDSDTNWTETKTRIIVRSTYSLLRDTITAWRRDKAQRMAAALAFYTAFSLAPLVVIVTAIAGFVFSKQTVQNRILQQIQDWMGDKGAEAVDGMIGGMTRPSSGIFATIVSVLILLAGASRLFAQLQSALDSIWKVKPKPGQGIKNWLLRRLISFVMVLGTGFLLLVTLVASAALSTILGHFQQWVPGLDVVWLAVHFVSAYILTAVVFAAVFKFLPGTRVWWKDVWIGALLTAVLFTIGKYLLGLYLSWGIFSSVYGAAGSIVVILFWVYYSAQIMLLGAEFSHSYAVCYGSKRIPERRSDSTPAP